MPPVRKILTQVASQRKMIDLLRVISDGQGQVKLEVSGDDLYAFSTELIARTKEELKQTLAAKQKTTDRLLTSAEVRNMCNICDTTLWHWQNKGILTPVKVGRKRMYKLSDVKRFLNNGSEEGEL